jgi:hypothetical protein
MSNTITPTVFPSAVRVNVEGIVIKLLSSPSCQLENAYRSQWTQRCAVHSMKEIYLREASTFPAQNRTRERIDRLGAAPWPFSSVDCVS